MKGRTFLFILMVSIVYFVACSDNNEIKNKHELVIDSNLFKNATSDQFTIKEINVEGQILNFKVSYGGGCGDVSFKLIDSGDVLESNPVQRRLKLVLDDNDNCEAYLTENYKFDLSPLKLDDQSEIILRVEGWDKKLVYKY